MAQTNAPGVDADSMGLVNVTQRAWSLTLNVRGEGYFDPRHPDRTVPLRARLKRIAAASRQAEAKSRGTRARSSRTPASASPPSSGSASGGSAPSPAAKTSGEGSGDDPPGETPLQAQAAAPGGERTTPRADGWLPNQVAVSVRQLADLWGTTAKAIYHRVARGQMPPPFHLGRTLMFRRSDLLRFMSEGRGPSRRE